jgi:cytochrome c
MKMSITIAAAIALFAASLPSSAAGNAERGAKVFSVCAACHSVRQGEHLTGSSLANVWGRKAGTAEGFDRYSEAMKRSGVTWNAASLDKWLADPGAFIHGTSMTFPGLRDAEQRADVIAYLHAVSEGKAPAAASGGGMMGGGRKADLRHAPSEGQVTSLIHCGDTYTVKTADGRVEKVWEFNLRLKTDSSAMGPPVGKPAIVGAGMQGDRASVVFSKPSEISAFIGAECRDSM